MEKIIAYSHPKSVYTYAIAKLFERASYYGLRAILVLYLIDETMSMPREQAFTVYSWFGTGALGSTIVGAFLGDLVLGNRKTIIIGGLIQAIGAIVLSMSFSNSLYIGLGLFVLGGGLFIPNLTSNFGKLYLEKTKLLDAGFSIFFLAINFGSFIGIAIIGYVGEKIGWEIGFLIAALFIIISVVLSIFSKEPKLLNPFDQVKISIKKRTINIILAFILVGVFWGTYEIAGIRIYIIHISLGELPVLNISEPIWRVTSSIIILPITIVLILLWSFYYSSQFVKLTIGFVFGAMAYGLIIFIPEIPNEQHISIYLISIFLLAISESYINPIIYSVITKYSNPKYLAIVLSLTVISIRSFYLLAVFFDDSLFNDQLRDIRICLVAITAISFGLLAYIFVNKSTKTFNLLD